MTVSLYTPEDYPTLLAWWTAHRTTPTPEACLPRLGVLLSDQDTPMLATWASMDNSCGIAFLLFPISNPAATPRQVATALHHALAYLTQILRDLGYHTLLSATHRTSLAHSLRRHGFTPPSPVHFQTLALTPPCLS